MNVFVPRRTIFRHFRPFCWIIGSLSVTKSPPFPTEIHPQYVPEFTIEEFSGDSYGSSGSRVSSISSVLISNPDGSDVLAGGSFWGGFGHFWERACLGSLGS